MMKRFFIIVFAIVAFNCYAISESALDNSNDSSFVEIVTLCKDTSLEIDGLKITFYKGSKLIKIGEHTYKFYYNGKEDSVKCDFAVNEQIDRVTIDSIKQLDSQVQRHNIIAWICVVRRSFKENQPDNDLIKLNCNLPDEVSSIKLSDSNNIEIDLNDFRPIQRVDLVVDECKLICYITRNDSIFEVGKIIVPAYEKESFVWRFLYQFRNDLFFAIMVSLLLFILLLCVIIVCINKSFQKDIKSLLKKLFPSKSNQNALNANFLPQGDVNSLPQGDENPEPTGDGDPEPQGDGDSEPQGDDNPEPTGDGDPEQQGDDNPEKPNNLNSGNFGNYRQEELENDGLRDIGEEKTKIEKIKKEYKRKEQELQNQIKVAKAELNTERENVKKIKLETEDACKLKYDKKEQELQNQIKVAKAELNTEKENVRKIKKETEDACKIKYDKKEQELQSQIKTAQAELNTEKEKVKTIKGQKEEVLRQYNDTSEQLSQANNKIDELNKAQEEFTSKVRFVPFAANYCSKINALFEIENKILKAANDLLNSKKIEDSFYLVKRISDFAVACNKMNKSSFVVETMMAVEQGLALNGNGISRISATQGDKEKSLRVYFLPAFLEKYVNALVVLTENLSGLHIIIPEIEQKDTKVFVELRKKIGEICNDLGINVLSVKVSDVVGNNMDVKAEVIDFDDAIPADTILEVSNCIVYDKLAEKPKEKIMVKAQK